MRLRPTDLVTHPAGGAGLAADEARGENGDLNPELSVVIVAYKCRDQTRECLASLYEATQGISFEIVVLDNASDDGTVEMIRAEFPRVRLIAMPENLGFAAGVNRAAAAAQGEYLLLLNPDTVVHAGAVEHVVAFARSHPEYAIYGGRTLNPDGSVNPGSCWGRPTVWSFFCFASMLSTAFKRSRVLDPESLGHWQRDTVREVDIVTGCLLLVRRALWKDLGGFDRRFFMYGEDADLALRTASAGLRLIVTPECVITHEVGASSKARADKMVLLFESKATLVRKHWSAPRRQAGLALLWLGVGLRALFARMARGASDDSGWHEVWRTRRRWLAGYPAVAADPVEQRIEEHAER
jgi:N-acetylglucosaminyl-diphospho-decaprenol L-rhamnosyltransferase